jgi:hypothetical protein
VRAAENDTNPTHWGFPDFTEWGEFCQLQTSRHFSAQAYTRVDNKSLNTGDAENINEVHVQYQTQRGTDTAAHDLNEIYQTSRVGDWWLATATSPIKRYTTIQGRPC